MLCFLFRRFSLFLYLLDSLHFLDFFDLYPLLVCLARLSSLASPDMSTLASRRELGPPVPSLLPLGPGLGCMVISLNVIRFSLWRLDRRVMSAGFRRPSPLICLRRCVVRLISRHSVTKKMGGFRFRRLATTSRPFPVSGLRDPLSHHPCTSAFASVRRCAYPLAPRGGYPSSSLE